MLGLHEPSLSYGQVAVERGTVSLNIMSQRENGFRVNFRAEGSTNAARRAIRVQFVQGGHPRFNSRCKRAMFREPFYHFVSSLVAIVRGIKSLMRIGFLYYNCLGFGLASD